MRHAPPHGRVTCAPQLTLTAVPGLPIIAPGDDQGTLTPSSLGVQVQSADGASTLPPVKIGGTILYMQALNSVLRDLLFSVEEDGFVGNDLSVIADHLFQGHTIVSMAYQRIPHSVVWLVRDDGMLLGLTYMREQQVVAWHRHTTDGLFKYVACVTEGNEDSLYAVVERTIDGATVQYIERMTTRALDRVEDGIFMDAAISYDGFALETADMGVSGGAAAGDAIALISSAAVFGTMSVGDLLVVRDVSDDDQWYFLTLTAIADTLHATATCAKALASTMQFAAAGEAKFPTYAAHIMALYERRFETMGKAVDAGVVQVRSRFHFMELRRDQVRHFGGRYRHTLVRDAGGALRIRLQRVDLFNAQAPYDYVLQVWI